MLTSALLGGLTMFAGILIGYLIWGGKEKKKEGKDLLGDIYGSVECTRLIVTGNNQKLLKLDAVHDIQKKIIDVLNSQNSRQEIVNKVILTSYPKMAEEKFKGLNEFNVDIQKQLTDIRIMLSRALKATEIKQPKVIIEERYVSHKEKKKDGQKRIPDRKRD